MILVIGYGNTLRGDDGAGQKVAATLARWHLPNVRSLSRHQLTPELAEDIANANTIIFVDARTSSCEIDPQVQIKRIEASNLNASSLGHISNPHSLLALAQSLYGQVPLAYWILIPGINFDFGEQLSPLTEQGVVIALDKIKMLLTSTSFYLSST